MKKFFLFLIGILFLSSCGEEGIGEFLIPGPFGGDPLKAELSVEVSGSAEVEFYAGGEIENLSLSNETVSKTFGVTSKDRCHISIDNFHHQGAILRIKIYDPDANYTHLDTTLILPANTEGILVVNE